MMNRRTFLGGLMLGTVVAPFASEAQQPGKVFQIGVLSSQLPESPMWAPFHEGLRELGYVEGKNIAFKWQSPRFRAGRFPDLAVELVRGKVDVVVAGDNPAIAAAQRATETIPIVMVLAMDPVASGFVRSLARPGGNITGLTTQAPELHGKALQLLKEAVPTASRVAILWDPTEPGRREIAKEAESAGQALGLRVQLLEARSPSELESRFMAMAREGVEAVQVQPSQMIGGHREQIAKLAVRSRLPTIAVFRPFPEIGGLMSYGLSYSAQYRRAAYYVAKLLGGARASDLPIEQPTKFKFVINLKTAKALGLTIPQSILLRADEVIQ